MKTLIILDDFSKLNIAIDTSIAFVRELQRRDHETWTCDSHDFKLTAGQVTASVKKLSPGEILSEANVVDPTTFDLILNRKEPPMDDTYYKMLDCLEVVEKKAPVLNRSKGIRDTNEKLSILEFPEFIPDTLVTQSWEEILKFQKSLQSDVVIKPLDQKGGFGVFRFKLGEEPGNKFKTPMMIQKFLPGGTHGEDKRVYLLDGKFLAASARHPPKGEFRTNLGLGAIYHKTVLTEVEKKIVDAVGSFVNARGLHFVGIDVMSEKLLEINVTCTGGLCETIELYPEAELLKVWADSLAHHLQS